MCVQGEIVPTGNAIGRSIVGHTLVSIVAAGLVNANAIVLPPGTLSLMVVALGMAPVSISTESGRLLWKP
ncbi:MAG TPA: hypothetical protein VGF67_16440 [Ktedonobacteraceae bacterium]|jgi:hypothetical protein